MMRGSRTLFVLDTCCRNGVLAPIGGEPPPCSNIYDTMSLIYPTCSSYSNSIISPLGSLISKTMWFTLLTTGG